jgi:ABC-type dipeptide/oligopeptide/nickel transport system permease component
LTNILITVTLVLTIFLCALNGVLAVVFRHRRATEIITYAVAGVIELGIFVFTLMVRIGILRHVPYHLPPGLPFNRAQIGATVTIAVGLLPAAYWHRTSVAQIRRRIAQDAEAMKQREGGVHMRSNAPGEWMN